MSDVIEIIETKAHIATSTASGLIKATAWLHNVADRTGDITRKGAFRYALPMPLLDAHNQAEPVGTVTAIRETDAGIEFDATLLVNKVARATELAHLIEARAIGAVSIGFVNRKSRRTAEGGREIQEADLLEISLVAVPAHPDARLISFKSIAKQEFSEMDETIDTTEATAESVATLTATVADLSAKLDTVTKSYDTLATKLSRPGVITGKTEDTSALQRKSFQSYLHRGEAAGELVTKALVKSTDTTGGYLVPAPVVGEFVRELTLYSPIRSIANVRSVTNPAISFPLRTSITNAAWVGETDLRTESNMSFGMKTITAKEIATYVDISTQLLEDGVGAEAEVRQALAEDFGKKETAAFVNGDGVLAPKGFTTDTGIAETVNGHATNLSADALINLMYAQPAEYRATSIWLMNGSTLATIRKLKDTTGQYLWQPSVQAGQPESILGRPVMEIVELPNATSGAFPIYFADLNRAYRIIDRVDMSVMVDPFTRATNGLVRIHARRRVGGDVVQASAIRKLKMSV